MRMGLFTLSVVEMSVFSRPKCEASPPLSSITDDNGGLDLFWRDVICLALPFPWRGK